MLDSQKRPQHVATETLSFNALTKDLQVKIESLQIALNKFKRESEAEIGQLTEDATAKDFELEILKSQLDKE